MSTLSHILISVFIVSAISLIGIVTVLFKIKSLDKLFFVLVSFAVGALLGAAFLDLLPESIKAAEPFWVFVCVLIGILFFLLMESFLYWYHCHDRECKVHEFNYLCLMGASIHNFFDDPVVVHVHTGGEFVAICS